LTTILDSEGGCALHQKKRKKEEEMGRRLHLYRRVILGTAMVASVTLAVLFSTQVVSGRDSDNDGKEIARGGGTTIIHGGTGSPSFLPVITTVAFHAERSSGGAQGEFDCLAFAPEAPNGPHSGQLTVNAMYVVGKITGASVNQDTVTLTGVSDITGLGAGTNVPFTFVAHRGGPGATANLTVNSLAFSFNEILVQGAFEVHD
jgi:hypothetical protein